ncbi:hypothetical protein IU443_21465 [Nocardia farcinica]|uniref:hypothetical protein n=1 Tax=Nocardia farcinica TaxID=37329 RepID=UPI001894CE54|nr:hypothetical protein [Nocardia farcinica]MBF6253131.1 hypothetical protein [Nocardia farcinica]MBF6264843.1 hypothetical protein [Nocardia farcinica]MBF6283629.1 hypothetical protein [Nocardia farcinica]MBF6307418.1 hypothetical protein [Nocardia farcinica]MBF6392515.1 hypothetical protein [Nocardia farcinica]
MTESADHGATSAQAIQAVTDALAKLADKNPELASSLAALMSTVVQEATRTPRFASALTQTFAPMGVDEPRPKRTGRRAPGIIDPYAVYAESGDDGLRRRLAELSLEQLRDIVAEHGMDHDRLAMKWKDPNRLISRIADKVSTRSSKGSAFRNDAEPFDKSAVREGGPQNGAAADGTNSDATTPTV